MEKEKKLPKKVVIVKAVRIAPDHVNTRNYHPGEVHEVGGAQMPEEYVQSLMDDGYLEATSDGDEVTEIPEIHDPTLDHAEGRHVLSAKPPPFHAIHPEGPGAGIRIEKTPEPKVQPHETLEHHAARPPVEKRERSQSEKEK